MLRNEASRRYWQTKRQEILPFGQDDKEKKRKRLSFVMLR